MCDIWERKIGHGFALAKYRQFIDIKYTKGWFLS